VPTLRKEIAFTINDVARLLKTYADQSARRYGATRAQWAVLSRLNRCEGLKQSELAEILDLQPISLTRLLDRLAENGLIERRPDPHDRRVNRLYLTPAARPLLDQLTDLGEEVMGQVLEGLDDKAVSQLLTNLGVMRENLRTAIGRNTPSNESQSSKVAAS